MAIDLGGTISKFLPSGQALAGTGSNILQYGLYFIILLIVLGLAGFAGYLIIQSLKYNKKIIIFEKINGRYVQTGRDKAMEIKYGKAGDTVFVLKKRKKYLPVPELQMGKRTYWFAIREDGEWINIDMEDIDLSMRQAKAHFLHKEMRAFRSGFQKNLGDRLDKKSFMKEYGHIIIPMIALVICGLMMWAIADRVVAGIDKANNAQETATKVLDKSAQVISSLDNLCSASGSRPAG